MFECQNTKTWLKGSAYLGGGRVTKLRNLTNKPIVSLQAQNMHVALSYPWPLDADLVQNLAEPKSKVPCGLILLLRLVQGEFTVTMAAKLVRHWRYDSANGDKVLELFSWAHVPLSPQTGWPLENANRVRNRGLLHSDSTVIKLYQRQGHLHLTLACLIPQISIAAGKQRMFEWANPSNPMKTQWWSHWVIDLGSFWQDDHASRPLAVKARVFVTQKPAKVSLV